MYEVNGQVFQRFTDAIAAAKSSGSDVNEVATGTRRWTPAPKVSAKRMSQYRNQKAAYDVQQAHLAAK